MGPELPLVTTMLGTTVSTADLERATAVYTETFDWHVHARGPLPARWKSLGAEGLEAVIVGPPEADRGLMRLVKTDGGTDRGKLPRAWSSIELIVQDLPGLVKRLEAHPNFTLESPGIELDMTDHGSNIHRAAVGRLEDCLIVFTMAVTMPEERDFPVSPSPVGHVFAAHLRSTAGEPASKLYRDVLGLRILLVVEGHDTFIHTFWGVDPKYSVKVEVLRGTTEGGGLGSVEVQQWPDGYLGPRVHEPIPRGIAAVTYVAPDLSAARGATDGAGFAIEGDDEDGFLVRGEEGEIFEITGSHWL